MQKQQNSNKIKYRNCADNNMQKIFVFAIVLSVLILFSGCIKQGQNSGAGGDFGAIDMCVQLCDVELEKKTDLSAGPCLSNSVANGWVCDVAHEPRAETDNNPANQCPEFGKTASHFVEVDERCKVIRAV